MHFIVENIHDCLSCKKNSTDRLTKPRLGTSLSYVKKTVSTKCSKTKYEDKICLFRAY